MPENPLLSLVLDPLAKYYKAPNIEEVAVNQPGEIWIKQIRGRWTRQEAPELTYDYLANKLCNVLANVKNIKFSKDLPIVACEIAGDVEGQTYRFQGLVGPNIRYNPTDNQGVAICIRVLQSGRQIKLGQFFAPNADGTGTTLPNEGDVHVGENVRYQDDPMEDLVSAVVKGKSILVSGSTSSGKALRNGTKVLTVVGWKPIEKLATDDVVLTPTFGLARVTGVYPQGILPLYRVTLRDGRSLLACGEHLWRSRQRRSNGPTAGAFWPPLLTAGQQPGSVLSTLALRDALADGRRVEIPAVPLNLVDQLHPAVLMPKFFWTEIASIEPACEAEATCISVDSPDKLYLAEGGIATHNTTFLNNLIRQLPLETRICAFQDTLELDIPHPNRIMIWAPRSMITGTIGYGPLLDSIIRLTPDAIIAGEISIDNAQPIARLLTMGHASFMSTIHAGNTREAVEAFVQNMSLKGGSNLDQASTVARLRKSIARRVQLHRDELTQDRLVTEIAIGD